jgi:hypothetical protein
VITSRDLLLILTGMLCALPAFADLLLTPTVVVLQDISESKKVFLTYGDQPVPPGDIKRIVFGVRKTGDEVHGRPGVDEHFSDYSYMFDFTTAADGSITITADRDLLQIGSYELQVYTVHGTAKGRIEAKLDHTNPTRPPFKSHMPRITYSPGQTSFLYGQAIAIRLGSDQVNTYSWFIDGELHSTGRGLTSLRAWPEPGSHEISVVARNPDGDVISKWSDTFDVIREATLSASVRKGEKMRFKAPSGHTRVAWYFDGKLIADNAPDRSERDVQSITFKKRGSHTLSCRAEDSTDGNFRLVSWSITVN